MKGVNIMNIQTHAYKSTNKKLTKEQAQDIIEQAYNNGICPDKDTLAELYRLLQPVTPAKAKTLTQWVYKGRSTEQARPPYLHHSYSDGENLVSTNGHIMLMIPTELEPGFYDGNGNKIKHDDTFPDYKRVVPSYVPDCVNLNIDEIPIEKSGKNDVYVIQGLKFNKTYIDIILNGDKEFTFKFNHHDKKDPCTIEFHNRKAIIMPLRA
jgi:hypothetical protein